jgi:hypothetical protein
MTACGQRRSHGRSVHLLALASWRTPEDLCLRLASPRRAVLTEVGVGHEVSMPLMSERMFALVDSESAADDTPRVLMLVGVEREAHEIAGELRRQGRRVDVRPIDHAASAPRTPAPRSGHPGS